MEKTQSDKSPSSVTEEKELKIIIIGMTGSGKSTLINMLANIISGLKYEDKRLFAIPCKLKFEVELNSRKASGEKFFECNIKEFKGFNSENKGGDENSKTTTPTFYRFKNLKTNTLITLIDTPGLSDTRGPEFDEMHIQTITHAIFYAKGVNLICIAHKATDARLADNMKTSIERLKNIFTEDSKRILTICLTNSPKNIAANCMDSLQKLEINAEHTFRFESSCLAPHDLYKPNIDEKLGKLTDDECDQLQEFEQDKSRYWRDCDRSAKKLLEHAKNMPSLQTHELVKDYIDKQAIEQIIYVLFDRICQTGSNQIPFKKELENLEKVLSEYQKAPRDPNKKIKEVVPTTKRQNLSWKERQSMSLEHYNKNIHEEVQEPVRPKGFFGSAFQFFGFSSSQPQKKVNQVMDEGYFVWVDVPYEVDFSEWRIQERSCDENEKTAALISAANSVKLAEARKSELKELVHKFESGILSNKQISKELLSRINDSKLGGLVSPVVLIQQVKEELENVKSLNLSDIFKPAKEKQKQNFIQYFKKSLGYKLEDEQNASLIQKLKNSQFDDFKNETQVLSRIEGIFVNYKKELNTKLVEKRSRLEITRDLIEELNKMPHTALSFDQDKELSLILREQMDNENKLLAELTARYRDLKPFVVGN